MRRATLAIALAIAPALGCGDSQPSLTLVLDLPPETASAYPFSGLVDALSISIAQDGSPINLRSRQTGVDGDLVLDDIPFGNDLVIHLSGELAGAEVAYGRTCKFDVVEGDVPSEVHLYFSRSVHFGPGATPVVADRRNGHAFSRPNGVVVVAGGETRAPLETFNPISGRFSEVQEAPTTVARTGSVLATLGDDHAVIVGGTADGNPVQRIETLPDLRDSIDGGRGLRDHWVTALVGDLAVVTGGESWTGSAFEITSDAFTLEVGPGGVIESERQVGSMQSPRTRHTATRLSNEPGASVLIAGGVDGSMQPIETVEAYRPLSESFVELPLASLTRFDHRAIPLPGGALAVVGGFTHDATDRVIPATDVEVFDPVEGRFVIGGTFAAGGPVTGFSTTILPDGRALIIGGRDEGGALLSAAFIVVLDSFNGQVNVTPTDSLAFARADHTAVLACDGTVLVIGGESSTGPPPVERYNPPSLGRR